MIHIKSSRGFSYLQTPRGKLRMHLNFCIHHICQQGLEIVKEGIATWIIPNKNRRIWITDYINLKQ